MNLLSLNIKMTCSYKSLFSFIKYVQ